MFYLKIVFFILLFFLYVDLQAQDEKKLLREGNELYVNKKYTEAEINYRKALDKDKGKEKVKGSYNLGDALYKQGKYEEAASQFQQLSSGELDEPTRARTYHNLGNSLLKANKYEESIKAYKSSLKEMPEDAETKYNLAYAQSKLIQQQQKNKDDKKDDDKKDKKDKDKDKKKEENKDDKKEKDDKGEKDKNKEGDKKDKDKEGKESKDKPEDAKDGKPSQKPKQLSPQDAQRILDALNQQEKDLQKKLSKKESKRQEVEKNW